MLPTPYVASLRVYEPLESFSAEDQTRWSKLSPTVQTKRDEQSKALIRTATGSTPFPIVDGAHLFESGGKIFVSPWSTAQRSWAALSDFKASLPSSVLRFFFPSQLREIETDRRDDFEGKVPHIITETWVIPPRWFALFEPSERLMGRQSGVAFTVARTGMTLAKQRCIQTHQAVRSAFGPGPVEEEIVQLLNWLNVFHPESIVELDYGGLAQYLDQSLKNEGEAGIESDTSIEDVKTSLAGLSAGDGLMAGKGYERLMSRWRKVAAYEQAT